MFGNWFKRKKTEDSNKPLKVGGPSPKTELVEPVIEPEIEEVKITVSKENGFFKVEISDYVSISNWIRQMENFKELNELITNNIIWNSDKQKREKGICYVFVIGNHIYNILINEYVLKIDERTLIDFDDESKKDNVTIERIICYFKDKDEYSYNCFKEDKTGDSFELKFYPNDNPILASLSLSLEEVYSEIEMVISNLEGIEGITSIIDLSLLRTLILEDMKKKIEEDTKKIVSYATKC